MLYAISQFKRFCIFDEIMTQKTDPIDHEAADISYPDFVCNLFKVREFKQAGY